MNSNFIDLLVALNEESVEYMVVGAYAVIKYTEPRYTKDLDIWINPTHENAERVFRALSNFGAPVSNISPRELCDPTNVYQIGVAPVRVDILPGIEGLEFEDCWPRRTETRWGDISVNLISLNDLITNKEATGRPQDLIDLERLRTPHLRTPER